MKHIVRIVVSAFALISAAACYNNEIENPDNPQNPEQSGLRITATMAKTRVNYGNETDAQLLPVWQEGDILFGFYGEDPDDNGIVLKVCDVDEGVAELEIVSGELANQNVETSVCLIYTGCNEEDLSGEIDPDEFKFDAKGKFDVDLTSQNLDRIPVCMSATATIGGNDAAKTLSFNFAYDCAVLEVETLAGFDEDGFVPGSLSGIEVSGISFMGKYSYDNGNITFAAVADDTSYSQSLDGWSVSADSELTCSGETKKILISAIPTSSDDIKISYKRNDSNICSETFSNRTLAKGNCYVIRHNYVAKTSDNHYFETVADAFDYVSKHPAYNRVTLVRKHIDGLGEHPDPSLVVDDDPSDGIDDPYYDASLMVEIDYDVTLDLNGCTLSLIDAEVNGANDTSEYFYVTGSGNFTIMDSNGPDGDGKYSGTLTSDTNYDIVDNYGTVNITGGYLIQNEDWDVVNNYGTLNVSGGKLQSMYFVVENEEKAYTYISGGELSTIEYGDKNKEEEEGYIVIDNYGTLEVSGGKLSNVGRTRDSENPKKWNGKPVIWNDPTGELTVNGTAVLSSTHGSVVYNDYNVYDGSGSCTIEGGTLSSIYDIAVENYGTCNILGGTLNSESYAAIQSNGGTINITGGIISNSATAAETIQILSGAECTISGGVIYSEGDIPTIGCRSTGTGKDASKSSTLTVKWPGSAPSNPALETGPIIYAKGASNPNAAPISVEYPSSDVNSNAVVVIIGGYLISSNDVFFVNNEPGDISNNLDLSNFGDFYSNAYKIRKDGDALGNTADLFYDLSPANGCELATGYKFRATKYNDTDTPSTLFGGFDMPAEIGGSTGDLYKIIVCKS